MLSMFLLIVIGAVSFLCAVLGSFNLLLVRMQTTDDFGAIVLLCIDLMSIVSEVVEVGLVKMFL